MGKAAFFPLLAAAPTLWVLQKGGSRGGLCLMALSGAALALALAWTPLAPAAVDVLAITAALALYAALWRRVSGDALPWYLLTAALSVAYILLTILPPPAAYLPRVPWRPAAPSRFEDPKPSPLGYGLFPS